MTAVDRQHEAEKAEYRRDTQEPKSELLPCPFCGGEATLDKDGDLYTAGCGVSIDICHVRVYTITMPKPLAIIAWNHRAALAAIKPAA